MRRLSILFLAYFSFCDQIVGTHQTDIMVVHIVIVDKISYYWCGRPFSAGGVSSADFLYSNFGPIKISIFRTLIFHLSILHKALWFTLRHPFDSLVLREKSFRVFSYFFVHYSLPHILEDKKECR